MAVLSDMILRQTRGLVNVYVLTIMLVGSLVGVTLLHPWSWLKPAALVALSQPAGGGGGEGGDDEINPIEVALYRVGYEPEALAAAGVNGATTNQIVAGAREWWAEQGLALSEADQAAADASVRAVLIARAIHRGLPDYSVAELAPARAEYAEALAHVAEITASLESAVDDHLTESQQVAVATIHGNRRWDLPAELRNAELTEGEWLAVIDAQRAELAGVEPAPADAEVLGDLQTNPAVALAAANRASLEAAVTTAWEAALQEE